MYHYAGSMETCSFHHHQKLDTWETSSEWWMLHQVVSHHPQERNLCKQPSNLGLNQPAKFKQLHMHYIFADMHSITSQEGSCLNSIPIQ